MSQRPFNDPFTKALGPLKSKLPVSSDRDGGETRSPEASQTAVAEGVAGALSDGEVFERATKGTLPLEAGGVEVLRRERGERGAAGRGAGGRVDLAAEEFFDLRFSERFIRGRADGVARRTMAKLEGGEVAVRSHVDLHGMVLEDALALVDDFLAERQRCGEKCVLVITGKGNNSPGQTGVLREGIPEWLARGPSAKRILAFSTARPCDGGEGALYVLLRKRSSRKRRIDVEKGAGP